MNLLRCEAIYLWYCFSISLPIVASFARSASRENWIAAFMMKDQFAKRRIDHGKENVEG